MRCSSTWQKADMRSRKPHDSIYDNFDLCEDSVQERPIFGPVCIESCISLNRCVSQNKMQANLRASFELEVGIRFGDLKNAQHRSVLNIPFVNIEGRFLPH